MPKVACGKKKTKQKSRNVPKKRRDVPKKHRDVPKKHTQLENDVLADSLRVRGSSLVQKKGVNAENGLEPQKKRKKSRNVPKKTQGRPEKTHSTGNWRTGRSPGS